MILSSVNFIKTSRNTAEKSHFDFSDFILGKIKDEEEKRGKQQSAGCEKCGVTNGQKSPSKSKQRLDTFRAGQEKRSETREEISNVTIETKDGFVINLDTQRNLVYLGKEENATLSNVFRQRCYRVKEGEKPVHLCTFQLHSDCTRFISVNGDRSLQIQVTDNTVDPSSPDERFFVLHKLDSGDVFLQPYAHKGYYLHHIDNHLYLRKLEINWRPPEEYFFSIGIVDLPEADSPTLRYSEADDNYTEVSSKASIPESRSSPSSKVKVSLFFGCFGGKSRKLSKKLHQKLKTKKTT